MRKGFAAAAALGAMAVLTMPACAQEMMETVVVTGARAELSESAPHITLIRRADHVITTISVLCDTREFLGRREEMRQTLRTILRQAEGDATISLSVEKNDVLRDFKAELIDDVIRSDSRPDTSRASIIVKTPITAGDTFDAATARISAFVKRIPRIGRSETVNDANWELTIVGPQQYHTAVVGKIAANAKEITAMFGPDYGVTIEGLQRPLQWYRAGQLDLALYVPYTMTLVPRRAN